MSAYIRDGYYYPAFIKGQAGLYEDVWIHFRPALPSEITAFFARTQVPDEKLAEWEHEKSAWIASHLKAWSIESEPGRIVDPIDADACDHLHDQLRDRITLVIRGIHPPDDPAGAQHPFADATGPALTQPHPLQLEADAKN